MTIESVLGAIIIGLVIGVLGRLFAPGKQNISILVTIIVGIIAAFLGSFLAEALFSARDTDGIDWIELLIQLVLAVIGVSIAANLMGRRRRV